MDGWENKENTNFFLEPKEFHKLHHSRKLPQKKIEESIDSLQFFQNIGEELDTTQKFDFDRAGDNDLKTQNTQDFRKKEDYVDMELEFSAEKPIHNFTRFELYQNASAKKSQEKSETSFHVSRVTSKNAKNSTRYFNSNIIGIEKRFRMSELKKNQKRCFLKRRCIIINLTN
jgi:hypothetical protein